MQKESFQEELKDLRKNKRVKQSSVYAREKLYIDENGIIRSQGRLNDTSFVKINTPIVFAYNHPLTILYIQHKHKCYKCSSIQYTLNKIRREITSRKLGKQIKTILDKCVICKKIQGRHYRYPEHPPLDTYRTKCEKPFTTCGCDYIGPLHTVNNIVDMDGENKREESYKIWIIIFTCLVTRMTYLAVVPNRSTESFMRALREVSARYNEPKLIISDNEGSFKVGNEVIQRIAENPRNRKALEEKGITWMFIPSRASSMGAVWERLVGIVKKEIMKIQQKRKFNEYDWRAHIVEIEAIMNDRPLTYVSDVNTEPEVITPKSLITGNLTDTELAIDVNVEEVLLDIKKYRNQTTELYKEKIKIKETFWRNLRENYLTMLRNANYKPNKSKRQFSNKDPKVGDVVIIHEEEMRQKWKMGVIHELIPSSDGQIRAAVVKTTIKEKEIKLHRNIKTVYRTKAIFHLYPLEINVEENMDKNPITIDKIVHKNIDDKEIEYISQEWEKCGWKGCKKPTNKILKWIHCERCDRWIHFHCMDLNPEQSYDDTFFACYECWEPRKIIQDLELETNNQNEWLQQEKDNNGDKRTRKAAKKCISNIRNKIENKQI